MPVERWSTTQVVALAPDAGSLKGARGVSLQSAGRFDDVLYGLCRGSGKNPYQVCVDLAGPAFKCSCPSRKFPCKHALALLLAWAEGGAGEPGEPPAFAVEWASARAARAARPKSAAPADPAAAGKRAAQRAERVAAGLGELGRWLDDQVHQGLSGAETAGHRPFDAMAARLVDAQAPAVASTVRRLGSIAGVGPQWADRLLGELGLLRLLVDGHDRLGSLPPGLAATVRARIGFPVGTEEVLAGPRVRDRWQVLGQADSDDGTLTTRRTWLRGAATGRFALLLSFAAPGQSLSADTVPGTEFDAGLCFYPGALPLRALVAERHDVAAPLRAPAGATGVREALAGWSAALAAEPWRFDVPVLLAGVVPDRDGRLIDGAGDALPLAAGHREPWWLLAAAGARPATVAAEWSAHGLRPLAAWIGDRYVPAAAAVPAGAGRPAAELPPELLAAALVGTARRAWSPPLRVAGRTLLPSVPGRSPATALLEAAGTAVVYRRAGMVPATGHEPVPAAPPETGPPVPPAAGDRLLRLLGEGGGAPSAPEILVEWLSLAAAHGGHVPAEALPALLDAGRRNAAIRESLGRVAGERGIWLAGQRPDWGWLLDEAPGAGGPLDPALWETGTPGQRRALLAQLRATDPAAGRALLAGTWAGETPDDRARFLGVCETGLSPDDDPFLERALDDRRKEVREAALDLLGRLPGAALGQRMAARARAAVTLERRSFGRDRLLAEPPEELDAALRRDGVSASPPRGFGIGAWLLEEIVAGTPLTVWTTDFDRDPAEVVALSRGHDWETPLLHGWAKAAIRQRDAAWAGALVENDARKNTPALREGVRWDLHLVLPPDQLAAIAADFLRREDHLANRLLAVHAGEWPPELAVAVVETIAHRARADRHSWQLAELCRSAAPAMPPRYAGHVSRLAEQLSTGSAEPSRVRPVADLARTLTFRFEMHLEFE